MPLSRVASAPSLRSRSLIERLIAFDTTSHKSNLECIGFIRDYLSGFGIDCRLTHDDDGRKANLFATIGPADRPGIVLSGHTDVVPVDGQPWDTDPFAVIERDGRLWGRGTSDMKSFIAVALSFVPELLKKSLQTPVHLAFSYDEEVGCIGVRRLIADLEHLAVRPRLCIVGEPTEMKVIVAHKSKWSLRCHVRGLECHSALLHEGVNSVEAAAELISFIKGMQRRLRAEGPFDPAFEPPYTSVHVGVIHGGTALNIVPRDCWFDFEIRGLPGADERAFYDEIKAFAHDKLEPDMKAIDPACGFSWEEINITPGLDISDDGEAAHLVAALSGSNASGKVSFGTEAGLFHEADIPTIICGPGNIEQAHKPNEFIDIDQIAQCEAFLQRLLDRVAG